MHKIFVKTQPLVSPDDLAREVVRRCSEPSYRPPRPPTIVAALLELSHDPAAAAGDYARCIEEDPATATSIVRAAQSPALRRETPVLSVEAAVVTLGLELTRDVVITEALRSTVFRSRRFGGWMAALSAHSVATGNAARMLARSLGYRNRGAYLGGLLHDIGAVAALHVLEEATHGPTPAVARAVDACHAEVGGALAILWRLPAEIASAIEHHHAPCCELSQLVCVADYLANRAGATRVGLDAEDGTEAGEVASSIRDLQIEDATLHRVAAELQRAMSEA